MSIPWPDSFPYPWVDAWGEDDIGPWITLAVGGAEQVFRWIPPGQFTMGSPPTEAQRFEDELQHEVVISKGFWMADTTCTQALWEAVMGENPSHFKGQDRPVERVNWNDVNLFMEALQRLRPAWRVRLPTESEWEYACRAGSTTPFSFGENITTDQVNQYNNGVKGAYREETVPVKLLPQNEWGLYQMHGNVREWCSDWYGDYPVGQVVDPQGPDQGVRRVLRGGSWLDNGRNVRSAYRLDVAPSFRYDGVGCRLALGEKKI